jgi:AbiV family abortive infection protein
MPSTVTPQFLLEGAVLALEQCGLLLHDVNVLFRGGSYASAVVLTAFAREELGRYTILLVLRKDVPTGKEFTIEDIQDRCDDHVIKQEAGMLSTVLTADRDSGLGKLLWAKLEANPQSAEWKQADAMLTQISETKNKRVPSDRHKSRVSALYVEPISEHRWNRPVETSAAFARQFMQDAVNDHAGRCHQGYITSDDPILKHLDLKLYTARKLRTGRPKLHLNGLEMLPISARSLAGNLPSGKFTLLQIETTAVNLKRRIVSVPENSYQPGEQ